MAKVNRSGILLKSAAILFALLLPVAAHACSYAIDPNNPDFDPDAQRNYYGQYFFVATWALLFLNIGFAFFSIKKYLWGVVVMVVMIPVQFAALVTSMLMNSCGDSYHQLIRYESGLLLALLVFQVAQFVLLKRRTRYESFGA